MPTKIIIKKLKHLTFAFLVLIFLGIKGCSNTNTSPSEENQDEKHQSVKNKGIDISKKIEISGNTKNPRSIYKIATSYEKKGLLKEACTLFKSYYSLKKKSENPDHISLEFMRKVGWCHIDNKDYHLASQNFKKYLDKETKDDKGILDAYRGLLISYAMRGIINDEFLNILEKINYYDDSNNLDPQIIFFKKAKKTSPRMASFYFSKIFKNLSLKFLAQRAKIFKANSNNENHDQVITDKINSLFIKALEGNHTDSENKILEYIKILNSKGSKNWIALYTAKDSLAIIYLLQKKYKKSEIFLAQSLEIKKNLYGEKHHETNDTKVLYALIFFLTKRDSKTSLNILNTALEFVESRNDSLVFINKSAIKLCIDVIHLFEKNIPNTNHEDNQKVFLDLASNALFAFYEIEHDQDKNPLQEVINLNSSLFGKTSLASTYSKLTYIKFLVLEGKINFTLKEMINLDKDIKLQVANNFFQEKSLNNKRHTLNFLSETYSILYQIAIKSNDIHIKNFALSSILSWQQYSLNIKINTISDKEDNKIYRNLNLLEKYYSDVSILSTNKANYTEIQFLEDRINRVENENYLLTQKNILDFPENSLNKFMGFIKKNTGILILRTYEPYENLLKDIYGKTRWLAIWLARDNTGKIQYDFHDLGPIEPSHALWQTTQNNPSSKASQALYQHLFSKLDKDFQKVERIYFAADGFLQLDDISHWRLPDGRYWIERQDIRRLNVARDLLRKAPATKSKGLITFGNIDYEQVDTEKTQQVMAVTNDPVFRGSPYAKRALQEVMEENLQNGEFTALKDSAAEVDAIQRYYKKAYPNSSIKAFSGQSASEYPLKHLKTPPHVLHFATHAFYLEDTNYLQRPLLLSGLALANANQGRKGITGADGEDGILYALEATSLNLQGTELVTLSACETAQGEMDYTEGVYGLIQAFKVAGAKNILMTLKKVNDNDARMFMDAFYGRWLKTPGQHPAVALRETKLAFINGDDKYQKKPEFWSPYILVEVAQ